MASVQYLSLNLSWCAVQSYAAQIRGAIAADSGDAVATLAAASVKEIGAMLARIGAGCMRNRVIRNRENGGRAGDEDDGGTYSTSKQTHYDDQFSKRL